MLQKFLLDFVSTQQEKWRRRLLTPAKWRRLTITTILMALIQCLIPSSLEWVPLRLLLTLVVGVYDACGLKFATAGLLGTVLLFCVLKKIVDFGGPIPLTSALMVGLNVWLAFLIVTLVHTPIDALLHASESSAT